MSDEPYAFGPTDPRTQPIPIGAPDAPPGTDPRAWGSAPNAEPGAMPPAGDAGTAAPAPWGAQPPVAERKRMSTVAKSLTAVGVAAVIAVGGTVAVTSANADNTSSGSSSQRPMGGAGYGTAGTGGAAGTEGAGGTGRGGGFGGGMASRSLIGGALHGEFVVADGTGTVTERLQTGSVTSISSSSITVLSTDRFTATYAVPSGVDVSALATGTTVTVIATVDGSTATVTSISVSGQAGGAGTGGFTRPDGSVPGGDGAGTGGMGTGTAPGGGAPGDSAPGGSTTGTTGEDSGV